MNALRVVSQMTIVAACLSSAMAILWYLCHRRGIASETRRVGLLLFACFLLCGLSALTRLLEYAQPAANVLGYVEVLLLAASLFSGLAVWPRLPNIVGLPSVEDLRTANEALHRKEEARGELMDCLTEANRDLERRVAERTSELLAVTRRFEAALSGSNISVAQQDRDLVYTWSYNIPGFETAQHIVGKRSSDFMPKDDADLLDEAKRAAMDAGAPAQLEFQTRFAGAERCFDERIEPLFIRDEVSGVISTAVDITERKQIELELKEVLRELSHRSKNLLAVVQGLARQTGLASKSFAQFRQRFDARLQALSIAHELLIASSWRGVDLRKLVRALLAQANPDLVASLEGPVVRLRPEVAQTLAIGLHEMATNAAAYGETTSDSGLHVAWVVDPIDSVDHVVLTWREDGLSHKPSGRGFGLSYIETLLPRALHAESKVDFGGEGVMWTLRFPLL